MCRLFRISIQWLKKTFSSWKLVLDLAKKNFKCSLPYLLVEESIIKMLLEPSCPYQSSSWATLRCLYFKHLVIWKRSCFTSFFFFQNTRWEVFLKYQKNIWYHRRRQIRCKARVVMRPKAYFFPTFFAKFFPNRVP